MRPRTQKSVSGPECSSREIKSLEIWTWFNMITEMTKRLHVCRLTPEQSEELVQLVKDII